MTLELMLLLLVLVAADAAPVGELALLETAPGGVLVLPVVSLDAGGLGVLSELLVLLLFVAEVAAPATVEVLVAGFVAMKLPCSSLSSSRDSDDKACKNERTSSLTDDSIRTFRTIAARPVTFNEQFELLGRF